MHITRYNIAGLSGQAYQRRLSASHLTSAFRKAGIYPFNSKVVEAADIAPATIYTAQPTTKDTSNENNNNKETTPENDTEILEEDQNSESILAEVNQTDNNPTQNETEVTLEDVTMVGDNEASQQTTDSEKCKIPTSTTSQTNIFLQKRTISSVIPQQKKRKSNYFSVTGNLAKKKNVEYLKEQKLK
jgi:hypothetical protein